MFLWVDMLILGLLDAQGQEPCHMSATYMHKLLKYYRYLIKKSDYIIAHRSEVFTSKVHRIICS
jgi:hypothetical protein